MISKEVAHILNTVQGVESINVLTIEECSELIQALSKYQRMLEGEATVQGNTSSAYLSITEEIADVYIMLSRLVDMMDNEDKVNFMINKKIDRTLHRLHDKVEESTHYE